MTHECKQKSGPTPLKPVGQNQLHEWARQAQCGFTQPLKDLVPCFLLYSYNRRIHVSLFVTLQHSRFILRLSSFQTPPNLFRHLIHVRVRVYNWSRYVSMMTSLSCWDGPILWFPSWWLRQICFVGTEFWIDSHYGSNDISTLSIWEKMSAEKIDSSVELKTKFYSSSSWYKSCNISPIFKNYVSARDRTGDLPRVRRMW